METDAGAGTGFKEKVSHDRAVEDIAAVLAAGDRFERLRDSEQSFEIGAGELVDGKDMTTG